MNSHLPDSSYNTYTPSNALSSTASLIDRPFLSIVLSTHTLTASLTGGQAEREKMRKEIDGDEDDDAPLSARTTAMSNLTISKLSSLLSNPSICAVSELTNYLAPSRTSAMAAATEAPSTEKKEEKPTTESSSSSSSSSSSASRPSIKKKSTKRVMSAQEEEEFRSVTEAMMFMQMMTIRALPFADSKSIDNVIMAKWSQPATILFLSFQLRHHSDTLESVLASIRRFHKVSKLVHFWVYEHGGFTTEQWNLCVFRDPDQAVQGSCASYSLFLPLSLPASHLFSFLSSFPFFFL
jgi:hypothetical protein